MYASVRKYRYNANEIDFPYDKKVKEDYDQEIAQSERNSHSKIRDGRRTSLKYKYLQLENIL